MNGQSSDTFRARSSLPTAGVSVLDACCGSRMFWFDRTDPRAVFIDKRSGSWELNDISSKGGKRTLIVNPDIVADFTALPFALVCFDPPHFERNGSKGWVGLKYGTLAGDWREMLRKGFAECFRVLKHEGVLVFKWCEDEILVSQILALTPEKPLFGNRCGKTAKTHWIVFIKLGAASGQPSHAESDRTQVHRGVLGVGQISGEDTCLD